MAIVQKVISGNNVENGNALVQSPRGVANTLAGANERIGSNYTVDAPFTDKRDITAIATLNRLYDARYDEPRYYSGDSATDS